MRLESSAQAGTMPDLASGAGYCAGVWALHAGAIRHWRHSFTVEFGAGFVTGCVATTGPLAF